MPEVIDKRLRKGARLTFGTGEVYVLPEMVQDAHIYILIPGAIPLTVTIDTVWTDEEVIQTP